MKSKCFEKESFWHQGTTCPISGKANVSFKKFGKINVGWEYLNNSSRVQDFIILNTISAYFTWNYKGKSEREAIDKIQRYRRCWGKVQFNRCNQNQDNIWAFYFSGKNRWGIQTCNKPQVPQSFHSLLALHSTLMNDLIQGNDFLININLKDAYFSIPLEKTSKKYICFERKWNLYEFLCLYFFLGLAPLWLSPNF